MNCKGYIETDFTIDLIVENTMNVRIITPTKAIPLSIAVCTDNLVTSVTQSVYTPTGGILIPSPCDSGTMIKVDSVTLTELRVTGAIGFYVGIDVLTSSSNVIIGDQDVTFLTLATVGGNQLVNDEILAYLSEATIPNPQVNVTVTSAFVSDYEENSSGQHCYKIVGTFRIDPVEESGLVVMP